MMTRTSRRIRIKIQKYILLPQVVNKQMQEAAMKIISKPMLDTNQQIEHLKGNGVTFVSYSEADPVII